MGTSFIPLLLLFSNAVDVTSSHAVVSVDGTSYTIVTPDAPFTATVSDDDGADIEIDFLRIAADAASKPPTARIEAGPSTKSIAVRAKLKPERMLPGQSGLMVSYPVRHRFPLKSGMSVTISVDDAPDGIPVVVRVRRPHEDMPLAALAPLSKPSTKTPAAPKPRKPKPAKKPPATSSSKSSPTPPVVPPNSPVDAAAPTSEAVLPPPATTTAPTDVTASTTSDADDDAAGPDAAGPVAAVAPPTSTTPVTPAAPVEPKSEPATAALADAQRPMLPIWIEGQMSPFLSIRTGSLSPLAVDGGLRLIGGLRGGFLEKIGVGIGVDGGVESASSRPGVMSAQTRWTTSSMRLRLEGAFELARVTVGTGSLGVAMITGIGVIVGNHHFKVGDRESDRVFVGPTVRLGAEARIGIGPGDICLTVPVDASFDVSSGVQNFWPFASTVFVGYRLAL